MFIVKRNFSDNLLSTNSNFQRLFEDNFLSQDNKPDHMTVPRANVLKHENGYSIELAAPGFTRDEFELSIDDSALIVRVGTEDSDNYKRKVVSQEYMFKSFTRQWQLPENANFNSISARYEAGILLINIPVDNKRHTVRSISVD
jgi:HSP20 family protein